MLLRLLLMAIVPFLSLLPKPAATAERAWQNLLPQADLDEAVGTWTRREGTLQVAAASGARIPLKVQPAREYDYRVTFTRTSGVHSIALMFVVNGRTAVCDIDAWGQHLAGIQRVNGQTLRERAVPARQVTLKNGTKSTALIEVRKEETRVLLDGELIDTVKADAAVAIVDEWRLPTATLGVGAWEAAATFHTIEYRPLAEDAGAPASSGANSGTAGAKMAKAGTAPPRGKGKPVRVLIVIANQDFFYREYADPREELEKAGIEVEVAAARKTPCRPHPDSGQGKEDGVVQPDWALSAVKPERYAAILFSGGWGASQYQYAFRGRYQNASYNGAPEVRNHANELINAFVKDDKYVAGLCHGVSVLAWSRIDGLSLLDGRAVCAATLPSPDGQHPGFTGVPASRWHAEVNGARLRRGNSVGNPNSSADDVAVDGKVITGQDDKSARELGRKLAELLQEK